MPGTTAGIQPPCPCEPASPVTNTALQRLDTALWESPSLSPHRTGVPGRHQAPCGLALCCASWQSKPLPAVMQQRARAIASCLLGSAHARAGSHERRQQQAQAGDRLLAGQHGSLVKRAETHKSPCLSTPLRLKTQELLQTLRNAGMICSAIRSGASAAVLVAHCLEQVHQRAHRVETNLALL